MQMVDSKAVAVETGGLEVVHICGGHGGVGGLLKDPEQDEMNCLPQPSLQLHNLLNKWKERRRGTDQ